MDPVKYGEKLGIDQKNSGDININVNKKIID
jgi:hypothetical protein